MFVGELKKTFLQYCDERGYQICVSFPITLKDDPTLFFVNATITPLRQLYLREKISSLEKCALVQRCLRLGGASELEQVGVNSTYHTFFEMMGTCIFKVGLEQVISEFLEFLGVIGLKFKNLFFTVPKRDRGFKEALQKCGLPANHILILEKNDSFWQHWQFGIPGPAGYGMTVIFTPIEHSNVDMIYVVNNVNNFLEFANVIYVTEFVDKEGNKIPLACPGFDVGIGVERLAAILQDCNNYEIDTIKPLTRLVAQFLKNSGKTDSFSQGEVRIITDHLRAICVLISEGVEPANKMHGYVLRKLIRRMLTKLWLVAGRDILVSDLIPEFSLITERSGLNGVLQAQKRIVQIVEKESLSFNKAIQKGLRILQADPETSLSYLEDTFGLPRELAEFVQKRKGGE